MLDMTDSQLTKVQTQLNQFVLENTDSSGTGDKKNWIKLDLLYGKASQGGRNLILLQGAEIIMVKALCDPEI